MEKKFRDVIAATPGLLLRRDLCRAAGDPKLAQEHPPVYVPPSDWAQALKTLSNPAQMRPFDPEKDAQNFYGPEAEPGLLYLPFPYLVPGGRFNEMYGWDTAFAVFAWADEHPQVMREQVDNHVYQIRTYGKVLNANRTYYLSRSHPPLTAAMALRVWRAAQGRDWIDFDPDGLYADARAWLAQVFPALEQYYLYWTQGERLAGGGPLSRYWDDSEAPAPEVASSEGGHFDHARAHFSRPDLSEEEQEDRALFYDVKTHTLTPAYHRANRAMRASGLDPTGHWDYGGLRCLFHAPVCLNALLYRMEGDMAELSPDGTAWKARQALRLAAMKDRLFDPATGLFHDWDFVRGKRSEKPFATIFHAFWAGLYDDMPDDARRAATAALAALETPHGILTSTEETGSQWDAPYGWPPIQYFAFAGLARCGLREDARRVARKYLDLALRVFRERGAVFEKYNVQSGSAEIHVVHGYHENVTEHGTFLWTAATLKLAEDFLKTISI